MRVLAWVLHACYYSLCVCVRACFKRYLEGILSYLLIQADPQPVKSQHTALDPAWLTGLMSDLCHVCAHEGPAVWKSLALEEKQYCCLPSRVLYSRAERSRAHFLLSHAKT